MASSNVPARNEHHAELSFQVRRRAQIVVLHIALLMRLPEQHIPLLVKAHKFANKDTAIS